MQRQDLIQTLLTRGESYTIADSLISNAKLPYPIETKDGRNQLPKLDYLKGQTFQSNQPITVEEVKPLKFQPLNDPPPPPKISAEYGSLVLQAPYPDQLEKSTAIQFSNEEAYKKQESLELLQKTKKVLVFHSLLNTLPKPFSLKLSNQFKIEQRYETGNLFAAYFNNNNFDFLLTPDSTLSNHQFYFSFAITGLKPGTYQFKFLNLMKPLKQAFQPIQYSSTVQRIGTDVCCFSGSFQRKTKYFYQDAKQSVLLGVNSARVMEMEEYKANQTVFKNQLKKQGLMLKTGKLKKGVEIAYNAPGNYYCYAFKFEVTTDSETMYFTNQLTCSYSWILKKISQLTQKTILNHVKIENLSYCRTYFGNQVPMMKIFQHTEKDKKTFLIISKSSPQDNSSGFALIGFLNELLGHNDASYLQKIQEFPEKDSLKIQFNKHVQLRQILFNTYTFYIIPVLAVDGTILGNQRTDNFGINYQKFFDQEGNYKSPQQIIFNQFIENLKIDFCLDLRSSTKIQSWKIDQVQTVKNSPIKLKIWEIFGTLGIIPKLQQDILARMFQEKKGKAFITQSQPQQNQNETDIIQTDIDKKFVSLELERQILDFLLQNPQFFSEISLFTFCKKFENFDFQNSSISSFEDSQTGNLRSRVTNSGGRCYTVYLPSAGTAIYQFGIQEFQKLGKEIFEFSQFLHDPVAQKQVREGLCEEYSKWVNATVLAVIGRGQLIQVEMQRYSDAVRAQVPEQLKTYSQMTDKERYGVLIEFNELVDFRDALEASKEEIAQFDSDDSVDDADLDVKIVKETEEEKAVRMGEIRVIRELFEEHFPQPVKKKKGKKGKGKKGKK